MKLFRIFNRKKVKPLPRKNLDEIKRVCRILFIDDEKFKMVDKLRKDDGWQNTLWVKDVDSIYQPELRDAHVVFVDVQGVGKKLGFQDEGLGLIVAIRRQYPNKKIVMYSAERNEKIDAFHEAASMVDARLKKLSDRYYYESILEKVAMDAFCLESCISRLKSELYNNYGISMSDQEIETNLMKINAEDRISLDKVSRIFNLQNAESLLNIIQFFLSINK